MKQNQLVLSPSFGLLRIDKIISPYCIYCTILTGELKGGITNEYATTIAPIPNTDELQVN